MSKKAGNKMKIIRFEVFQEVDLEVDENLEGMALENYIDRWVATNYPSQFRSDWWDVTEKEKEDLKRLSGQRAF